MSEVSRESVEARGGAAAGGRPEGPPPAPLAVFHLLIFGGLAVLACVWAYPEWRQLVSGVAHPYWFGDTPRPLPLVASLVAAVALAVMVARVARRRTVSLFVSLVVLGAVAVSGFGVRSPARGRDWAAADLGILRAARALHRRMNGRLQARGEVATTVVAWRRALGTLGLGDSPVRHRLRALPFRLEVHPWGTPPPSGRRPGTLLVSISPDGAAFAIDAVGFSAESRPALLDDGKGKRLTLRGLYHPKGIGGIGAVGGQGL